MNPRTLYVGGFVLTAGFISYNEIKSCSSLPWPPRIVSTAIVFALLEVMSGFSPELAGVTAIGFGLAMIVNHKIQINKGLCDSERSGCKAAKQTADTQTIPGVSTTPGADTILA